MDDLSSIQENLPNLAPIIVTLVVVALALSGANWFFLKRSKVRGGRRNFTKPIVILSLTAIGIVAIIIALPIDSGTKDQLIGLFGLVLTGMIALSSTTFVSNAMAGFMIRSVGAFRSGDFVKVGDQFGRVSARGLFHTEIQTEDRDLTTLPNLYLISNPVSVVHSSGTIVSAKVSLGYDTHHSRIEPLLIEAALASGLQEPFVQVIDLGDFTVNYRVAGFLENVKQLMTIRSKLRMNAMDTLHGAGIEIMSPSVMMQRPVPPDKPIIPKPVWAKRAQESNEGGSAEEIMFDKADQAEEAERVMLEIEELHERRKELKLPIDDRDQIEKERVEKELADIEAQIAELEKATES